MIQSFYPEATTEYAEYVPFYNSLRTELGTRFNKAVKVVIANASETLAL